MSKRKVFCLYPYKDSTRFVRVLVHESMEAMQRHWEADSCPAEFGEGSWDKRRGYCRDVERWTVTKGGRLRRDPCVAEVHLVQEHATMEVVSHEFFHATMAWGRRTGFDFAQLGPDAEPSPVSEDEEDMAYLHGYLCRDYMNRAIQAGVYVEKRE